MYIVLLYTNNKYWQVLLPISTGAEFKTKKLSLSTELFVLVREAGLEVAVPNSINFLVSNYVINSSESVLLYTTQSIDFMLCDSVKGQKSRLQSELLGFF